MNEILEDIKLQDCACCKVKFKGFELLSTEQLQSFKDSHCRIEYGKGETIVKQGTPVTNLICLKSGFAKAHIEGIDGKSIVLKVLKEGDFLISPGIFNDNLNHCTVTALTNCSACLISLEAFEKTFDNNPEFAHNVLKQDHQLIDYLHQKLIKLSFKKMNGRVADTFIYLAEEIYKSSEFYTTLSRQDLADIAGVSKESLIRIVKDFKDSGIIDIKGNKITILSLSQLTNISKLG